MGQNSLIIKIDYRICIPYLLAILFKQPKLKALIELHLFVLPEFVGMRVRRTDGGELGTNCVWGATVESGPLAAAHTSLRARCLRYLQPLQYPFT